MSYVIFDSTVCHDIGAFPNNCGGNTGAGANSPMNDWAFTLKAQSLGVHVPQIAYTPINHEPPAVFTGDPRTVFYTDLNAYILQMAGVSGSSAFGSGVAW